MIRGVLSNWVGLAVTSLVSFLLTPLLIHGLGDFHFGLWMLVSSVTDYYGLLDLGIRTTLHRYVARFKGQHERKALDGAIVNALVLSAAVAAIIIVLTVPLMIILPGFFVTEPHAIALFRDLFLLLAVTIAIQFPAQVLGACLGGLQRFDLYNLAAITTSLVRGTLLLGVLRAGLGVLGVGAVSLVSALLALTTNYALLRRADPALSLPWSRASWMGIRELTSFSVYVLLYGIGDYLRSYTPTVVTGRILGVALVTPLTVAMRLIEYYKHLIVALVGPLMPAMSELDGQARRSELQRLFLRGTRITTLFGLFLGALLYFDGRLFIRLWLGDRFAESFVLMLILLVANLANLTQAPSAIALLARGKHHPFGWWTLGEGIATIVLTVLLAEPYGLRGIAVGAAVPMLVGSIVKPWYTLGVIGLPARAYLGQGLARPLIVFGLFLVTAPLFEDPSAAETVTALFWAVGWQTLAFGVLTYLVGLPSMERRELLDRGRRLWLAALSPGVAKVE